MLLKIHNPQHRSENRKALVVELFWCNPVHCTLVLILVQILITAVATARLAMSNSVAPPTVLTTAAATTSAGLLPPSTSTASNGSHGSNSTSTSSNSSTSNNNNKGSLTVSILSAYDLPAAERPTSVSLSCLDQCVSTGAPLARHKDRNSFKFPSQPLVLNAPLPRLYPSTATLTVHYRLAEKNLQATLPLQTLKIQQPTWLILNLTELDNGKEYNNINSNDDVPPTLRIQVELQGPYRPEISAILTIGQAWFGLVDQTQGGMDHILKSLPALPDKKYFLVPAVPVATALVVLSPIVVGVLLLGLPLLLPLVVVLFSTLVGFSGVFLGLYASTEAGRSHIGNITQPIVHTILSTTSGQRLVFETGPRPTPVSVARIILPKELMGKLLVSLCIDLVGSSSYLLPFVGEGFDLAWAPIQTVLIMAMYDTVSPNLKYLSFVEEILPFTDVVPSATIGWLMEFGPTIVSGGASNGKATTSQYASALATTNTAALLQKRQ